MHMYTSLPIHTWKLVCHIYCEFMRVYTWTHICAYRHLYFSLSEIIVFLHLFASLSLPLRPTGGGFCPVLFTIISSALVLNKFMLT